MLTVDVVVPFIHLGYKYLLPRIDNLLSADR